MANALKLMNRPYKLVLVPGVDHAFDWTATAQQWQEYILPAFEFAQQYLQREEDNEITI